MYLRMAIPGDRVTDAAKPVGAGRLEGFEHRRDRIAQMQVGMSHYRRRRPGGTVDAAGAGRGQSLDEFNLAHGTHFLGAVGAVHRSGLNEDGRPHVVAAVDVVVQFVEQIPLVRDARGPKIPKVVVGVADGKLGLQNRLLG